MKDMLVRNWWVMVLRGLAAVAFGILAMGWPGITLTSLILVFAAYALFDGVFSLVAAVRQQDHRWVLALEGVAGVAAGLAALFMPRLTALVLLYIIAAWAIVTGVSEIMAAIRMRSSLSGKVLLGISGALSIGFGILLMVWPGVGALTVLWLIGAYALAFGGIMMLLGFRLRSLGLQSTDTDTKKPGDLHLGPGLPSPDSSAATSGSAA